MEPYLIAMRFGKANYLGISVAYWLSFGLSFVRGPDGIVGDSAIRAFPVHARGRVVRI